MSNKSPTYHSGLKNAKLKMKGCALHPNFHSQFSHIRWRTIQANASLYNFQRLV